MTVSPGSLDSLPNESVSVADFTSVSVQSVTGVGPTPMLPATPTPTPPLTQTPPWLSALGAPNNFSVSDQSTTGAYAGGSWHSQGTAYSGPIAGLTSELIAITPDNLNITAATPNVFISLDGGSGEDAISVSR